jgi:ubiquitin-protein ligase E3 C
VGSHRGLEATFGSKMFQTFSGNARRPRQVNLSGQNVDPFAATSWAPVASGTSKSVAAAQEHRVRRQIERDQREASKRIQRVWRGHRARRRLANELRDDWDRTRLQVLSGDSPKAILATPDDLKKLLSFYDYHTSQDVHRLVALCQSLELKSCHDWAKEKGIFPHFQKLTSAILSALRTYVSNPISHHTKIPRCTQRTTHIILTDVYIAHGMT